MAIISFLYVFTYHLLKVANKVRQVITDLLQICYKIAAFLSFASFHVVDEISEDVKLLH